MTSDVDAGQIIGRKRYELKKAREEEKLKRAALDTKKNADKFERIHHFRSKVNEEIVPLSSTMIEGEKYEYTPPVVEINGPLMPEIENLNDLGYLQHIKAASSWQNAGGYMETMGCYRALMESHCGLFE